VNDDNHDGPVDRALDLFVYAPLGLALTARETLPGLLQAFATRGRAELEQHRKTAGDKVGQAKTVGRFAVDYGAPMVRRRVEERLNDARGRAEQTFSGLVVRREPEPDAVVGSAVDVVDVTRDEPDEGPDLVVPAPGEPVTDAAVTPRAATAPTARSRPFTTAPSNGARGLTVVESPSPAVIDEAIHGALAIPDYDELSASQVVQRLPGLGTEELEAIRAYETHGRGRRTILGKIDQLTR
jgi:hypothetical protein